MPFNHEHRFVEPDAINRVLLRQHLVKVHKMDPVDIAFIEEARVLGEQHQLQHSSEGKHGNPDSHSDSFDMDRS